MSHSNRVYSTIPIEVTRIGEHLNTIATTVARNPVIEEVTGQDFLVYLTYSYDEKDRLGWVVPSSPFLGIYQGTQRDAQAEFMLNLTTRSMFGGATWYETEEEAEKAKEEYEAQIATPAQDIATEHADDISTGYIDPDYRHTVPVRKKWYQFWL